MIDQKFLALDLELNQPSNKIIQVGVAIGSIEQDPKDYVVRKWYINPNEPIDSFIVSLTGITDSDIRSYCVSHETVARELTDLVKEHKPWLNAITWGFDDAGVLRKEFEKNHVEFKHFGGRWLDLKTVFNFLQFSKFENPRGGLTEAMSKMNCSFVGKSHQADADAQNTLKFWFDLMKKQNKMFDLYDLNNV